MNKKYDIAIHARIGKIHLTIPMKIPRIIGILPIPMYP